MQNFFRAVRLAVRNRVTLVGVAISSLLVGVLWGANIGVVYPFVEVVFKGQSLQSWIDDGIQKSEQTVEQFESEISQLRRTAEEGARPPSPERLREIQLLETNLGAERAALRRSHQLQPFIHTYLPREPFRCLLLIVGLLVLGTALKDAAIVANMILVERLSQLTLYDLRKQFFRQTLRLDMAAFGSSNTSQLLSNFTHDVQQLNIGLSNLFGKAFREPLKMIVCLTGASFISWRLLVFSLLVSPPALLLMRQLARSLRRANRRAMEEMAQIYSKLTETLTGIQTVKAFTMEAYERNRFHQSAKEFYRRAMRIVFYNSLTKPVTELLGVGVISLALIAGAYLVLEQETHLLGIRMCDRPLSLSSLLLFYGFLAGVSDPARKLSEIVATIQGGTAAADRIYQMMDRTPSITDPAQPQRISRPHQKLVFDDVRFSYEPGEPVLGGINLEIEYGETIAIVGPNGCGKSTLANLIPRFYDPTQGVIRINDVDLRHLRLRDLRSRLGLVTQQTYLFDDTAMNNIRYGSPRASDREVQLAADQAHAHGFITEQLSDGYDTQVGQGGGRLSGGQRQRIALARAILRNPEILILDEATSQIDVESEQLIHDALEEFARGRTAIMITHRLSTLRLANRIVVMEQGHIVAVGSHQYLIDHCELYRRLHEIQFRQSA
jgi:ATP-binding cassette subfamily B protein/subfamily B ATP-binding cassette protein MsbA